MIVEDKARDVEFLTLKKFLIQRMDSLLEFLHFFGVVLLIFPKALRENTKCFSTT